MRTRPFHRRPVVRAVCVLLLLAAGGVPAGSAAAADKDFVAGSAAYKSGDREGAFRIWKDLAERGDGASQFNIGRMYATGDGTARDKIEAYKWLLIAARRGRVDALAALKALGPTLQQEERHEAIRRADAWRSGQGG